MPNYIGQIRRIVFLLQAMESDKVKINILGCCVSRDTIDYKKEKYVVPRYAAFVSPWSMLNGNQVDVALEDLVECGISNFQAKCLLHDAQLSTINFLKESESDWLLFDLADSRLNIVVWKNKDIALSLTTGLKKTIGVFEKILGIGHENVDYLSLKWDEYGGRKRNVVYVLSGRHRRGNGYLAELWQESQLHGIQEQCVSRQCNARCLPQSALHGGQSLRGDGRVFELHADRARLHLVGDHSDRCGNGIRRIDGGQCGNAHRQQKKKDKK